MTTTREMVLIGGVADMLNRYGSWTGETHIQKTCYISKVKYDVPFESEFVLYKHGPFSFELSKSIGHMIGRGLFEPRSFPGYGPSLELNIPLWKAINIQLEGFFSTYSQTLERVCNILAKKNVSELERVSTAIFVNDNFVELSLAQKARKITEFKSHISLELAESALVEADSI